MRAVLLFLFASLITVNAVFRIDSYFTFDGSCTGNPVLIAYAGYGVCMPIGADHKQSIKADKNSAIQYKSPDCTGQSRKLDRTAYDGVCKLRVLTSWLDPGNVSYPSTTSSDSITLIYSGTAVKCPGDSVCSGNPIGATIHTAGGCNTVDCTQPEAEVLKVTMDIVTCFFHAESCDIHLNHGDLLDAIWSWVGIKPEHRQKVAELLSMMASLRPQSSERKLKWRVIRRQLLQELNLAEAVVNRLQTVGLRFCGAADQALPRLRGALPADKPTRKALDELSDLFSYLRIWRIEKHVYIDALMPPTESYHRDLFFQIYLMKENNTGSLIEGALLAVGGRYDYLLHQMWDREYVGYAPRTNPPGAVGVSLALETIIQHGPVDFKPIRNETSTSVLVCSRGGGGLLVERMELVDKLWEENIKAQFVPIPDPSLTEQYEYASEHDIKCLVIITDTGVSQTGFVKVRHLEVKKEKEVERDHLVKFLLDATATQFRKSSLWN